MKTTTDLLAIGDAGNIEIEGKLMNMNLLDWPGKIDTLLTEVFTTVTISN